ncbi:MAG: amidohydrolase family protein [Candidatus Dormibacteraeota bacterium]|nr:amidohydrolase family protein [Candidatus Dormibacteraeota bacterium]
MHYLPGMVIDTHQHLGRSRFSGHETDEVALLEGMASNGIDLALVLPQATLGAARPEHDRIAQLAARNPGQIRGVASICPWIEEDAYIAEAFRCVRELGFVALKLDPNGHGVPLNNAVVERCFAAARELGVAVIVHTGTPVPNGLPSLAIPWARSFPTVPVVLAHAGFGVFAAEAMLAARSSENVFLEPSWCPVFQVREFHRELGPTRLMFGSDHVENMAVELMKWRSAGLSRAALETVLEQTPKAVFRL